MGAGGKRSGTLHHPLSKTPPFGIPALLLIHGPVWEAEATLLGGPAELQAEYTHLGHRKLGVGVG